MQRNRPGIAQTLLTRGADADTQRDNGQTPTYVSACKGCAETLEVLLDYKADVNRADHRGSTPLFGAAMNGQTKAVETLLLHARTASMQEKAGDAWSEENDPLLAKFKLLE